MSADEVLTAIQRHRSFSQAKIEVLQREIAAIERDTDELAIAEKVVRRLASEPRAQAGTPADPQGETQAEPSKPSGDQAGHEHGDEHGQEQKNSGEDAAAAAVQAVHDVAEQSRPQEGAAGSSSAH